MPIRFRCAYCNQLMAISRRKAGTVVRCPKCTGEIIVPAPEGVPALPQAPGKNAFDVDNFDAYLDEPAQRPATQTQPAPTTKAPSSCDLPVASDSIRRKGLFLPMGLFFLCLGVIVLLLFAMFVVGYLVGRS